MPSYTSNDWTVWILAGFQLSYTIHRPSRIRRRQVIGEEHELQKLSRASDLLFILWLWLKVKVHQKASNSYPYSKSALKTKSNKLGCSGMITEVGIERPTSSAQQVILLSKTYIVVGSVWRSTYKAKDIISSHLSRDQSWLTHVCALFPNILVSDFMMIFQPVIRTTLVKRSFVFFTLTCVSIMHVHCRVVFARTC